MQHDGNYRSKENISSVRLNNAKKKGTEIMSDKYNGASSGYDDERQKSFHELAKVQAEQVERKRRRVKYLADHDERYAKSGVNPPIRTLKVGTKIVEVRGCCCGSIY